MGDDDKKVIAVESPVRITADGTKSLDKATDTAAVFIERVVMPPAEALAGLATELVDLVRGPFRLLRLDNLRKLGVLVAEFRERHHVTTPKPLPPKVVHNVIEGASFVEDDELRKLWAHLIVNAQAGMEFDAYLFEILSKLDSQDVRMLKEADDRKPGVLGQLGKGGNPGRLLGLGLVSEHYNVEVDAEPRRDHERSAFSHMPAHLEMGGYNLTELAYDLLAAVEEPKTSSD